MQDEDYIKNIRIVYNRKNEMCHVGKRNARQMLSHKVFFAYFCAVKQY